MAKQKLNSTKVKGPVDTIFANLGESGMRLRDKKCLEKIKYYNYDYIKKKWKNNVGHKYTYFLEATIFYTKYLCEKYVQKRIINSIITISIIQLT